MTPINASIIKKNGHMNEQIFNNIFGDTLHKVNYSGSSADNYICVNNCYYDILYGLSLKLERTNIFCSLKSGSSFQFHLGNINELSDKDFYKTSLFKNNKNHTCGKHNISFNIQNEILKSFKFWEKYLKKGELLCVINDNTYIFFNMNDIINLIISKFNWRLLDTGRIRGDIYNNKGIITFEYRPDKNQFLLGHSGKNSGLRLLNILKNEIKHIDIKI
jgi:hypothetical protein